MINAALLLLPPRFMKYIIVHELSHRLRADHSPAFWRIVEQAMPRFDAVRKELMEYRLPSH
jgi:predicted metal-dependent hydrolase